VTVVTAAPVAAAAPDNKSPLFFRLTQALNLSLPNADFRHGRGTLLADTVLAATALVVAAGLGYWLVAGSLPRRAIHGLSELPGRIRRRPR
jgi:hypothetical protein